MPEYPDIENYLAAMKKKVGGRVLERARIRSLFLVRSHSPSVKEFEGKRIVDFHRIGKRIVWEFEDGRYLVFHLMIAGRFRWKEKGVAIPNKLGLAAFDFENGSLLLTEAGTKKRASLYAVENQEALRTHDPGGLDVFQSKAEQFLRLFEGRRNTIKRLLTDPKVLSGIGNAYSDEILHRAGLSPVSRADHLSEKDLRKLYRSTREVLKEWAALLKKKNVDGFPDKVTAFHDEMAVHGRFGKPCPACGTLVQRIRYADNECNYCPTCQTGGKLLADRAFSRLLKEDWPQSLDELEEKFK